ncbi:MAG: hypothetical protein PWR30_15 [Candidatus Woesearchaeota archaeon]|nr:hypothetical protein [Candidatus Woesearchaeota archaeon]
MQKDTIDKSRIRISAASIDRIIISGKYLLILNKSRLKENKRIYTPVGGAIKIEPSSVEYLKNNLDAEFEDEKDKELRLSLPKKYLLKFQDWFYKRRGREITPYRELKEELIDESKLLNYFSKEEIKIRYAGCHINKGITDRPGQSGKETIRFLELFDVSFSEKIKDKILNSYQKNEFVSLVGKDEIENKMTRDGIQIASTALLLIRDSI